MLVTRVALSALMSIVTLFYFYFICYENSSCNSYFNDITEQSPKGSKGRKGYDSARALMHRNKDSNINDINVRGKKTKMNKIA